MQALEQNVVVDRVECGRQIQKRKVSRVNCKKNAGQNICESRFSRVESTVGRLSVWEELVDVEVVDELPFQHFRQDRQVGYWPIDAASGALGKGSDSSP